MVPALMLMVPPAPPIVPAAFAERAPVILTEDPVEVRL